MVAGSPFTLQFQYTICNSLQRPHQLLAALPRYTVALRYSLTLNMWFLLAT
jgi:hypothetical protein